jgi:hypothetical protein
VIEAAFLAHIRDEEIEMSVAVVITPRSALGATLVENASLRGDVNERSVSPVVIEPAAVSRISGRGGGIPEGRKILSSHKKIEPTVVVEVAPGSGLACDRFA